MRMIPLIALVLLVPACKDRAAVPAAPASSQATAPAPPAASPPAAAPLDEIARLARRIEACEHFAGEEPYDAARAAELRKQIEANCPGNDEELARLRGKYRGDARKIRELDALQALQTPLE